MWRSLVLLLLGAFIFPVGTWADTPRESVTSASSSSSQIVRKAGPNVITIGLIDTFFPDFFIHTFSPTVDKLMAAMPDRKFRFVEIDHQNAPEDIDRKKPDFLISSASTYLTLAASRGAHQIGTRMTPLSQGVSQSVSSVFIVRADSTYRSLADLIGKTIAVTDINSFEGWLIAQGELARQGFDPNRHFSEVLQTHYSLPDVAALVALREVDAGVLAAGQYEALLATGSARPDDFRILADKTDKGPVRSTLRYPDAVFMSLPSARPDDVNTVTVALLSIRGVDNEFRWQICNDFVATRDLLKTLALGPYSYLKDMSIEGLMRRFQTEIILFVLFALAVVFHIATINMLVRRRTAQLSEAIDEIRRSHEEAENSRKRLFALERAGVVLQLSGLFAHEIKQPVMNIALYCGALKMYLKKENFLTDKSQQLLNLINTEVERSSDIISHVRSYAKKRERSIVRCSLVAIAREAVVTAGSPKVQWGELPESYVMADAFELQFVCANFIKNARDAVKNEAAPLIKIDIISVADNWALCVADNGPAIGDEAFAALGKVTTSSKSEGLGFGLAIASGIAEAHGGYLKFERVEPHGIRAIIVLRKAMPETTPNQEKSS